MSQSRCMSFVEAASNVTIGYGAALCAQIVVFPLFGMTVSIGDNVAIGAIFTAVSLVRSYAVRRLFNAIGRVMT